MTNSVTWHVRDDIKESDLPPRQEKEGTGMISGFDFSEKAHTVVDPSGRYKRINFHTLLMHLWPGDYHEQLNIMNQMRTKLNQERSKDKRF